MIFGSNLIYSSDINITGQAMIDNLSGRLKSGLEIQFISRLIICSD